MTGVRSARCAPPSERHVTQYFLSPDVFVCRRGEVYVFLDLRRDDYTMVDGECAVALTAAIGGIESLPERAAGALDELLRVGLLTTDATVGSVMGVSQVVGATNSLVDAEALPEAEVRLGHVWQFTIAHMKAFWRLRFTRLEKTVRHVERRKQRANLTLSDLNQARDLTASFQKIRLHFPLTSVCLTDSLALLEFLAMYGIFPDWIFGVKLEPWAAHCWVQKDDFLFNEIADEAGSYSPVMSV